VFPVREPREWISQRSHCPVILDSVVNLASGLLIDPNWELTIPHQRSPLPCHPCRQPHERPTHRSHCPDNPQFPGPTSSLVCSVRLGLRQPHRLLQARFPSSRGPRRRPAHPQPTRAHRRRRALYRRPLRPWSPGKRRAHCRSLSRDQSLTTPFHLTQALPLLPSLVIRDPSYRRWRTLPIQRIPSKP